MSIPTTGPIGFLEEQLTDSWRPGIEICVSSATMGESSRSISGAYRLVSLPSSALPPSNSNTYSSSMVSWGGSGSSSPKPIISHVKVLSTFGTFIGMLPLKLKSSTFVAWGDSALKCHRSTSRPFAIAIEGSVTLKLVVAAGCGFCFAALFSTLIGKFLLPSGVVDVVSWVLSSVSTCSACHVSSCRAADIPWRGGMATHLDAPPELSHSLS